uniref:Uncharacterized protein MANES_18G057500 n=1 Tax=Rhizophora mucronata TaxID=61149 RepID=A0A2P2KYC1_RHIMU
MRAPEKIEWFLMYTWLFIEDLVLVGLRGNKKSCNGNQNHVEPIWTLISLKAELQVSLGRKASLLEMVSLFFHLTAIGCKKTLVNFFKISAGLGKIL